jgi:hypothetical protein
MLATNRERSAPSVSLPINVSGDSILKEANPSAAICTKKPKELQV